MNYLSRPSWHSHFLYEDAVPENCWSAKSREPVPLREMDESAKKEYWAALALRHSPQIGARSISRLLKKYGSALAAINDCPGWREADISEECARSYLSGKWRDDAKKEWDQAASSRSSILLWDSAFYPRHLRELIDAPAAFYCRGDTGLLGMPCVALVGARSPTAHGLALTSYLARSLSSCGITVVSGMALGIDAEAHRGALSGVGKSIGVLGTGINVVYPKSNLKLGNEMLAEGLLVSEFPPDTPPFARNFPIRNRIISGLSLGVVVVEAAVRSGSLITARIALEQNREVFAVAGPAMNANYMGCQNLIRQGARPVFNVDDILVNLAEQLKPYQHRLRAPEPFFVENCDSPGTEILPAGKRKGRSHKKAETPSQSQTRMPITSPASDVAKKLLHGDKSALILERLTNSGAMGTDALAEAIGMAPSELNPILIGMEMLGQVKRLPGARYEATNGSPD